MLLQVGGSGLVGALTSQPDTLSSKLGVAAAAADSIYRWDTGNRRENFTNFYLTVKLDWIKRSAMLKSYTENRWERSGPWFMSTTIGRGQCGGFVAIQL